MVGLQDTKKWPATVKKSNCEFEKKLGSKWDTHWVVWHCEGRET